MTTTSPQQTTTAPAGQPAPPRLRRRPAVLGIGVALVAAGGLTAAWLTTAADTSSPVVVAAAPLLRGQVLTQEQLTTARVSGLSPSAVTPAADVDGLVGKTVVTDVPAGAPVPGTAITDAPVPAAGQAVVGILLSAGQVPSVNLLPGARVRIVATPRSQEDPPTTTAEGTAAVLVSTSTDPVSGSTVVNVAVPAPQAAAVAALAATGRAALVLDADEAVG